MIVKDALPVNWAGTRREDLKAIRLFALALPLFALAPRLFLLGDKSVWWDEAFSAWTARLSLSEIFVSQAGEVHPPLYYSLLHLWRSFSGDSEFALRYVSALFGVLAVAVLYRLGARFATPQTGIIAAGLLALSRFHIWWSQEIRMYALATALTVISLYLFLLLVEGRRGWVVVAYGAANVLLMYTLYIGVLAVLAQNLAMLAVLVARRQNGREFLAKLARWAGLQLLVALCYAPWLYAMLRHAGQRPPLDAPLAPSLVARIYATVVTLGVDVSIENYGWLVLALLAFAVVSSFVLFRRPCRRVLAGTLWLYLAIPPVLIYLLSLPDSAFYTPQIHARYFLLVVPAWCLLLGLAISEWRRRVRWLGPASAVGLFALGAYFTAGYYDGRFKVDDYQTLTANIRAYARPGDAIVLNPDTDWPLFTYHHAGGLPWVGLPNAEDMTPPKVAGLLQPVWDRYDRVWLVSTVKALSYDPEGNVLKWLNANGKPSFDQLYGEQRVTLFRRKDDPARYPALARIEPEHPLPLSIGNAPAILLGYDQPLTRVASGQVVFLTLWWQANQAPKDDYGLSLALVDATGQVAAERSWQSLDPAQPASEWTASSMHRNEYRFPIRLEVPGGRYQWRLRVLEQTGGLAGQVTFGALEVVQKRRPGTDQRVEIARPLSAHLGDEIELAGYDAHRPENEAAAIVMRPGEDLRLTLYWRALQPMDNSYTVFVHFLGSVPNARRKNMIWGQHDTIPGNGDLPTTGWSVDALIGDEHIVTLDDDAPPGEYAIEVGMYERASGRRLAVMAAEGRQAGDSLIIGHLHIR